MSSGTLPGASLPIFDFSGFRKGTQSEKSQTAGQVVEAFKTYGFVYLVNHGIEPQDMDSLFAWSKKFFYLPEEIRAQPDLLCPESKPGSFDFIARGYSPVGKEKLTQNTSNTSSDTPFAVPDAKEMFEVGPGKGISEEREPNKFPPEEAIPGFRSFLESFFSQTHELGMDILRCIATGLGLETEYFVKYHLDEDNLFRLIRYPAVERASIRSGKMARTSPHMDHGSITVLFQDNVGGLQVQDPAAPDCYIVAEPIEGAVIVNVGDFLMRWTNDILKSNLHRVVEPPAERALSEGLELSKERFSIPFFIQAVRKKVVECVNELVGDGAKYEPVSAGQYLGMRRNASFKPT